MVEKGAGPSRSGFLSAFFTLVGTHGVHVASGLIALIYLMAQVIAKGLQATTLRRLLCWSLFWHPLDIVWALSSCRKPVCCGPRASRSG